MALLVTKSRKAAYAGSPLSGHWFRGRDLAPANPALSTAGGLPTVVGPEPSTFGLWGEKSRPVYPAQDQITQAVPSDPEQDPRRRPDAILGRLGQFTDKNTDKKASEKASRSLMSTLVLGTHFPYPHPDTEPGGDHPSTVHGS
jgi:hypothetical protein